MLLTLVLCVFGWPLVTLLPAFTRLELGRGEQTYSLLVSAVGAGALVAALGTATFGNAARRGKFLVIGAAVAVGGPLRPVASRRDQSPRRWRVPRLGSA